MLMVWVAILLGILQGILEWLPVSSQGQLSLAMIYLFKIDADQVLNFSVFLHTGTLLAVTIYFRNDITNLLRKLLGYRFNYANRQNRLVSFLLLTTILTGVVGYPIYRILHTATPLAGEAFIALIGVALVVTGLVQKYAKVRGGRGTADLNLKDTVLLGVAQGLSVIPGLSRSGTTTSFLIFRKFSGEEALRLSFLMSIPTVLIAEIGLVLLGGLPTISLIDALASIGFTFLFGLLSIHILMKIAQKIRFWVFCFLLGILALLPLLGYLL